MVIVMFHVEVDEGHEAQFIENFKRRPKLVDRMRGFISTEVIQNTEQRNRFIVMSKWESAEDFMAWTQSEAFDKAHARGGVPTKSSKLEIFEVVAE